MIMSLKRSVQVAALAVTFAASGSGMALAGTTSGNHSILGGNQISLPISIPVNICGNAIAILGGAFAECEGGASVSHGSGGTGSTTSGNGSIGGGNQVSVPISVPVNVCGNSVAALGTAASKCQGGSHTGPPPGKHHHHHQPPPPRRCHHHHHHHEGPPPAHHHHHHGGTGSSVTPPTPASTGSSTLPTTGANFLGLLALAGSVTVGGAGSMLLAKRGLAHGLLGVARRVVAATR
jgi:ChpA-C